MLHLRPLFGTTQTDPCWANWDDEPVSHTPLWSVANRLDPRQFRAGSVVVGCVLEDYQ